MKAENSEQSMPRVNPGESLRDAREALGMTLADTAAQLNLTVARLQQLEAGEFDKLPGHTFARGYVRSYARLLGLDPNRIVLEFDQFTGTDAEGSQVQALGRIDEPARASQTLLRLLGVVLLLGLAAVGFYWWQERSSAPLDSLAVQPAHIEVEGADGTLQLHPMIELEDEAASMASEALPQTLPVLPEGEALAEGASAVAAVDPLNAAVPVTPTRSAPVALAAPSVQSASQPAAEALPGAAPAVAAPVAAAQVAPAQAPQAEAAQPVGPGQGVVEVSFSDTCWVQVTEAGGRILLGGLKRKGESVRVVGKAPLELRLGVARAASVSFNGAPVDIAPYTSNETARVNLGQ